MDCRLRAVGGFFWGGSAREGLARHAGPEAGNKPDDDPRGKGVEGRWRI